jgi:hypothetical protein
MRRRFLDGTSERGATLIHVAIALVVLVGFSAFAVDYGILWVSRGQAQNSADAAALAAAVSLSFDSVPPDTARARAFAKATGERNPVWGQAPDITAGDVIIGPCPPGSPGAPDTCVRVNVYRNQTKDPLPTLFGRLVGVTSQGVRATATAQMLVGDKSNCVKPWAVPDKWEEHYPVPVVPWNPDSTFDAYDNKGKPLSTPDAYIPPGDTSPGTGFTVEYDFGTLMILKPGNPHDAIAPGWFLPVDLPGTGPGGDVYRENIENCNGNLIGRGDWLTNETGNMIGPTKQGVDVLVAKDPGAYWDPSLRGGRGGVAGGCMAAGTCAMSPRLVALPVFDTLEYETGKLSGRQDIRIVNVLGFFVLPMQGNDVAGYLTHYPSVASGNSTLNAHSAFLRMIVLVR